MNKLDNLKQFEELLANYKASDHVISTLQKTKLLLLAGVTSSGRNTVVNELLKSNDYHYIVSDTTREPRLNHGLIEQDGKEYWFKSEEEFLAGLKKGDYVEAAIIHEQQVSGISIKEIDIAHEQGKIAVTDIEVVGVKSIFSLKPDTMCVFMIPPSFDEWIKRINGRGKMPGEELNRRLRSAIKEIDYAIDNDNFILLVNDEFHNTAKLIKNIFRQKPEQERPIEIARELQDGVRSHLSKTFN